MTGGDLKNGVICALAIAAFAASTVVAVAVAMPQSPLSDVVDLVPVHEARATLLAASSVESERARSRTETERTLRQAPANSTAWLRLAYLDSVSPGGFGDLGNLAFSRSYSVAPYGPDDTVWRLGFAFNHWRALSASNRKLALSELTYVAVRRPSKVEVVKGLVTDPVGFLALNVVLETGLEATNGRA